MTISKGKIVLTKFPFTDISSAKRRPALVLSRKQSSQGDVIVAFISSNVPDQVDDTDFIIEMSTADFFNSGLKKASVIKLDKLATVNVNIIAGELGQLTDESIPVINEKLKFALAL